MLNGFSFLSCLNPSTLSLKEGLQIGVSDSSEVPKFVSCIILKCKEFSFKCLQSIEISETWLSKFRAILPFPLLFKCKPFLPRCLSLTLLFSEHYISRLERCLLRFRIVSEVLPSSLQNAGLGSMTLQLGRGFNLF